MLSSQTKDEITYHAMLRLRENNLTPEVICNMKESVLENILHPVSFYKVSIYLLFSLIHFRYNFFCFNRTKQNICSEHLKS